MEEKRPVYVNFMGGPLHSEVRTMMQPLDPVYTIKRMEFEPMGESLLVDLASDQPPLVRAVDEHYDLHGITGPDQQVFFVYIYRREASHG